MLLKPSYISDTALNDLTRWRALNEATLEMHKAKTPGAIMHVLAKNLNKIGFSVIVGELNPPMTELKLKFASLFDHEQEIDPVRSQELLSLGGHILPLSFLQVSRSTLQEGTVEFVTWNLEVLHDALGPLFQRILDGLLLSNELVLSAEDSLSAIVASVQSRGEEAKNYLTLITSTHISPDDMPLITAFIDLTALMMANKTLRYETKAQQKNTETLREVSKVISSNLDSDKVLTSILEQLAKVIAYDSAAIMLEHQGHLRLEAGRGIDQGGLVPEIIVPVEASPLYQEMKRGREPIIINDVRNDPRFKFWAGTNPIRSWIGVPLILHDKVIGQISVDSFKKHSFKKADADLAFAFAQHVVTAIQRDMSKKIELDKLKTEFLVTASHELRTPLTTIIGYTELLLNRQFSSSEINHYLKYIYDQSKHLSNLVSDLLDVSRMEAGTAFIVAPERIDPGPIFNQIVEYWQEISPKHDIRLTQPEGWPDIEADPDRLKQVLNNLLSNAVKYSPDGGIVAIEVKKNLSNLRVSIQDQGIGMTLDEQQHLFENFWRADAGSVAVEGTGLGMVIVKHIIKSHGGQIWVSSRKGEGTTVNFTWPRFNVAATVLIIEDEPSVLEIEESLLRMEGYHVMTADSGRKGLDLAVSEHPDLIILDLMLPELGGEEILYKLKGWPTTQNIPVVVVSAKSGLTNIEQIFTLGATDFLTKPFDFDEFLGRIKIALLSKPM